MSSNQERDYQRDHFVERYRGQITVAHLKVIFKQAWGSCNRIGDVHAVADNMVFSYTLAKNK